MNRPALPAAFALAALLALARAARGMLPLTRGELAKDWRAIKEQL